MKLLKKVRCVNTSTVRLILLFLLLALLNVTAADSPKSRTMPNDLCREKPVILSPSFYWERNLLKRETSLWIRPVFVQPQFDTPEIGRNDSMEKPVFEKAVFEKPSFENNCHGQSQPLTVRDTRLEKKFTPAPQTQKKWESRLRSLSGRSIALPRHDLRVRRAPYSR